MTDPYDGMIFLGNDADICYFGNRQENKQNVYYYDGSEAMLGDITLPQGIYSYDYVSMPNGTFYRIFDNGESENPYFLVKVDPNSKTIEEIALDFSAYEDVYPLFYFTELGENAFAIWALHADTENSLYYHDILKYDINTNTITTLLEYTIDRLKETLPNDTRYLYGISSDNSSFYLLTSIPQGEEKEEYYIQQYDFNGVFQREFLVPDLQKSMLNQFIQYFDCATNMTFIFRSTMGQFKVYQLQQNKLEQLNFGKISDGVIDSMEETAELQPFIGGISLINNKLILNDEFPYIYIEVYTSEENKYICIFNTDENKMYHIDFDIDEKDFLINFSTNRKGDILIHCDSFNTKEYKYYFISAEDIISNMKPCEFTK